MTEEGIDAGGKAGMSRKLIAGIIVAVVVIASIGVIILVKDDSSGAPAIGDCEVYWNAVYTESGWRVEVLDIVKNHEKQSLPTARDIMVIVETTLPSKATYSEKERFWLNEVTDTPSPYGISWVGKNKFTEVEIGDYIFINRSGGNAGKLTLNDSLYISGYINSWPGSIYLPPAEFLEMDVVKTATGWNMTVTWVNESVPERIFNTTSFRLENESGVFFTTYKKNEIVGEWFTTVGLGGIYYKYEYEEWYVDNALIVREWGTHRDMGYYNITWYDNDNDHRLSVNDSIVIDNDRGLVESGYKFKLTHMGHYGAVHVMEEIVLP